MIRRAVAEDTDELVRLRGILLRSGTAHFAPRNAEEDAAWQASYRTWLRDHREDDSVLIAVHPADRAGHLWACAIAVIDTRAPGPGSLDGRAGWAHGLVVDPDQRGRGVGVAVINYALDWLRAKKIGRLWFQASPANQGRYLKLGFTPADEFLLFKDFGS
jgi:GNAT superfamily N-acetyltransferase